MRHFFSILMLATLAACASERGVRAPGGLVSFDNPHFEEAWADPAADFGAYDAVIVANAEFDVGHEDRQKLVDTVTAILAEEFWRSSQFEVVDEPGSGVLIVVSRFRDVAGGPHTLEARDSLSGQTVFRGKGRSQFDQTGQEDGATTSWVELRRWARDRAVRLRQGLDSIRK